MTSSHSFTGATLADWLAELSAAGPVPGGGAAAAVSVAQAAALVTMVAAHRENVTSTQTPTEYRRLITTATELVDRDAAASGALITAWHEANDTPRQHDVTAQAQARLVAAARTAIASSIEISDVAADVHDVIVRLLPHTPHVIQGDLLAAASFAAAATDVALANAVGNRGLIPESDLADNDFALIRQRQLALQALRQRLLSICCRISTPPAHRG